MFARRRQVQPGVIPPVEGDVRRQDVRDQPAVRLTPSGAHRRGPRRPTGSPPSEHQPPARATCAPPPDSPWGLDADPDVPLHALAGRGRTHAFRTTARGRLAAAPYIEAPKKDREKSVLACRYNDRASAAAPQDRIERRRLQALVMPRVISDRTFPSCISSRVLQDCRAQSHRPSTKARHGRRGARPQCPLPEKLHSEKRRTCRAA